MRIELLREAESDLVSGWAFYERQGPGLGQYFLDSLFADIDCFYLYTGLHAKDPLEKCATGCIASLHPRSPLAYLVDMSRGFAAGRLALHPAITLFQRFLKLFGFHRLLAKRFPYAMYGDVVQVYTVLDCRRSPTHVSERLEKS